MDQVLYPIAEKGSLSMTFRFGPASSMPFSHLSCSLTQTSRYGLTTSLIKMVLEQEYDTPAWNLLVNYWMSQRLREDRDLSPRSLAVISGPNRVSRISWQQELGQLLSHPQFDSELRMQISGWLNERPTTRNIQQLTCRALLIECRVGSLKELFAEINLCSEPFTLPARDGFLNPSTIYLQDSTS